MTFIVDILDPLREPAPPAWDEFVRRERLAPWWSGDVVRGVDFCAQRPSSMVIVRHRADDEPTALFHVRHLGLTNPARFTAPGRPSRLGLTECRTFPAAMGPGFAFASAAEPAARAAAMRAFEQAIGRYGWLLAYRDLTAAQLTEVTTRRRLALTMSPSMVLHNEWADVDSYLASLPRKWRAQLAKIAETVRADPSITVDLVESIDPAQACWLADVVRRKRLARGVPRPPIPARFFELLGGQPGVRFQTYRDGDGRLFAYMALYDNGTELVLLVWGSRSETEGRRSNLYFHQYLDLITLMLAGGRKRLVMGKGLEQIKGRYGARPEPLWSVVGRR